MENQAPAELPAYLTTSVVNEWQVALRSRTPLDARTAGPIGYIAPETTAERVSWEVHGNITVESPRVFAPRVPGSWDPETEDASLSPRASRFGPRLSEAPGAPVGRWSSGQLYVVLAVAVDLLPDPGSGGESWFMTDCWLETSNAWPPARSAAGGEVVHRFPVGSYSRIGPVSYFRGRPDLNFAIGALPDSSVLRLNV